jgi:N6-L-threonylcarbamoyladenine synthase
MRILGIETSCDETSLCVLDARIDASTGKTVYTNKSHIVVSQALLHKEYGGVFPAMAKREHQKNIIPALSQLFKKLNKDKAIPVSFSEKQTELQNILEREPSVYEFLSQQTDVHNNPNMDAIAVTHGPGLEPALWVGINTARALGHLWGIPVIPVNHMEGHIWSAYANEESFLLPDTDQFPITALLVSGGHTELVLVKDFCDYEIIGQTKDDASGEAFDKIARLLGLPYPGGVQISQLAKIARDDSEPNPFTFPRPMMYTHDFDFSFSGLKTAVRYTTDKEIIKNPDILSSEIFKQHIAQETEDAIVDVLTAKTIRAIHEYQTQTCIVAGGVSANGHLRTVLQNKLETMGVTLLVPPLSLTGDNALMIALAGHIRYKKDPDIVVDDIRAVGSLSL